MKPGCAVSVLQRIHTASRKQGCSTPFVQPDWAFCGDAGSIQAEPAEHYDGDLAHNTAGYRAMVWHSQAG